MTRLHELTKKYLLNILTNKNLSLFLAKKYLL